jgi:hypothetical protein
LVAYPWSSLRHYPKGNAPEWQPLDRVLDAFRLNHERRGRAAYVSWLAARLCIGHPAAMCQLVSRTRKDPKIQKILRKHEKTFKSKDCPRPSSSRHLSGCRINPAEASSRGLRLLN